MNAGGLVGTQGVIAATAIAQAINASGVNVSVNPDDFLSILQRQKEPLVVQATGGWFRTTYYYLTSYKGLAFSTKSDTPVNLPQGTELVEAERFWMPA